jgi:hypothetical protein
MESLPPNEEAKGDKQESDGGECPDSDLVDDSVLIANIIQRTRKRAYADNERPFINSLR